MIQRTARLVLVAAAAMLVSVPASSYAADCSVPGVETDGSSTLVLYGPGAYPVGTNGHTGVEIGECGGFFATGDAASATGTAGPWSCKQSSSGYICSGVFQRNSQSCYVEWTDNKVDGNPFDPTGDSISYILCV